MAPPGYPVWDDPSGPGACPRASPPARSWLRTGTTESGRPRHRRVPTACYDLVVAFARWDPIRDLLAIQQHLDRFAPGQGGWTPPVDLYETATEYVLTAELPGLSESHLQIQVRDARLTIAGVRQEPPATCAQYHRVERGHGSFSRTFQLPHPVDADRIRAELRDGVLTVVCPKVVEGSSRRIDIL